MEYRLQAQSLLKLRQALRAFDDNENGAEDADDSSSSSDEGDSSDSDNGTAADLRGALAALGRQRPLHCCEPELQLIGAHLKIRTAAALLAAAMEKRRVGGTPEHVDTSRAMAV